MVLNFWASWCPPCRTETPLLEKLQRQIASQWRHRPGRQLPRHHRRRQRLRQEFRLTYPSLRDVDGDLAQDYGTRALPETFVIDRQGKVTAVSRGQVNAAFLSRTWGRCCTS